MNAAPHALATALAHARFADSVSAKGREGTGPHKTTPNGVLRVGDFPIHSHLSDAREAASTSEAKHATAWMGRDR